MKSVIVTASVHHGNTRKVVDAIAKEFEVDIIDATQVKEKDLSGYDLIGFASGVLGVGVTYLLCIPINAIVRVLTNISNFKAHLPVNAALVLIAISVCLTLLSGLIPSRSAAKKDPVVALRTE